MDRAEILEDLRGEACLCGAGKEAMRSFCYNCYKALPRQLQKDLYKRFEKGYAGFFEQAVDYLKQIGRIT